MARVGNAWKTEKFCDVPDLAFWHVHKGLQSILPVAYMNELARGSGSLKRSSVVLNARKTLI